MKHIEDSQNQDIFDPYTPLDSRKIITQAIDFANFIEKNKEDLKNLLLTYESHEVVEDEIHRTLDLLLNLSENESYFKLRVGQVTTFLPRNQPLYALTCFVIVPSLMASEVHFRIPHAMPVFFSAMIKLLEVKEFFANIFISEKQRLEFLIERSALRFDPSTNASRPVTDAVIFTGTSEHALQLRHVFDRRTLFISNGSGHNPIVIGADANIDASVQAVITLQFYNQGQDCAAPNSILVHQSIYAELLSRLQVEVSIMKIGSISTVKDIVRIQDFLCGHSEWIDPLTPGIIETKNAIVRPTIITKPLSEGGNYSEIFAPIIFLQSYVNDTDLASYFELRKYAENAMYITLYGSSNYVEKLIDREVSGRVIHPHDTFLHNTHLHAPGIERGTQPYGGYGVGASSLSIGGTTIALPTLPQRDIYEHIAKPMLDGIASHEEIILSRYSSLHEKNVQKILRLTVEMKESEHSLVENGPFYVDTNTLNSSKSRYIEIQKNSLYQLISSQNAIVITELDISEKQQLEVLVKLIKERNTLSEDEFKTALYTIPKRNNVTEEENRSSQKYFFEIIYQLLFAKNSGPKLFIFLRETEEDSIIKLLDIL